MPPEFLPIEPETLEHLRRVCLRLPEAYEEPGRPGVGWRIRKRSFAHVVSLDGPRGQVTVMIFRAEGTELEMLRRAGHPFFRPRSGRDGVGIVLDGSTDWEEVEELITDSFCLVAPKKLAALVLRPDDSGPG